MSSIFDLSPLEQRVDALVDAAKKAGADQCDAIAARGLSRGIEIRNGAVEEMESAEGDDVSLRVFVGKRNAIVSTSLTDIAAYGEIAERAVAMAKASPEDDFADLAPADLLGSVEMALDLVDETSPSFDTLREMAEACEDAIRSVEGVSKSGGASASFGLGGTVLATSHGFSGSFLRSRFGVSGSAIAGEGTQMERDYDYSAKLHFSDLEDPATVGRQAGERAIKRLNPQKVPTGTGVVVYDPRVSAGLVGHLSSAVNGSSIARGTSFLKQAMGEQVFNTSIRISDDPLRIRGLRSRPFDGEGLPSRPLDLVMDGVIQSWVLDCGTAKELGLASTAHASRGIGGPPSPSTTNLTLHPGEQSPEDMIKGIESGVYVTELIGRGANLVTGDYSRGAAGFRIENGELTYPVAEITIAGHLRDMFAHLVPANDLTYRMATNAPTIAIEGMTIAGV